MTLDIATIGVAIDSGPIKAAKVSLDDLAVSGGKAEVATGALAKATDTLSRVYRDLAVAAVAWKAYEYIKDVAMLNARYTELGIVMQVVGKNAGYSASEMARYAKEVQGMGISMIESRNTVIQLSQAQISLADAGKLARVAQDAAVIGATNSSDALQRMIYGIKSGQVETLRTLGINVSFEQSYKKMADTLGVTTQALSEKQKMQARENAVMDEGAKLVGTYEAAMTSAGKQIRSMQRYTDDLKVLMGEVFNEALTVGVMALTNGLKDANGQVSELAKNNSLKEWGNDVADTFAFAADAAMSAIAVFLIAGKQLGYIAARTALFMSSNPQDKADLDKYNAAKKAIDDSYDADMTRLRRSTSAMRDALADRRKVVKEDVDAMKTLLADPAFGGAVANGPVVKQTEAIVAHGKAVKAAIDPYIKIQDAAAKYIATLQKEADQLGLTDKEKALYNASSEAMTLHAGKERDAFMKNALALIDQTDAYKTATEAKKAAEKAAQAQVDSDLKATDALHAQIVALRDGNETMRLHNEEIGLTTAELDRLTLKRIDEQITVQQGIVNEYADTAARGGNVSGMQEQINKLDELNKKRGLTAAGQVATGTVEQIKKETELAKESAKKVAEEWKHGWEETDRIGRETFIGLAIEGKSFAETVGKSLKTSLAGAVYDLFARPIMLQIYTSVMGGGGAAGSALGAAGQAGNLWSAGSGAYSAYGSAGSAYGGFASGWGEAAQGASFMGPPSSAAGGLYGNSASLGSSLANLTGASNAAAEGATALANEMGVVTQSTSGMGSAVIGSLGYVALFAGLYMLLTQDHGIPTQSTGSASSQYDQYGNRTGHTIGSIDTTTGPMWDSAGNVIDAGGTTSIVNSANAIMVATMETAYLSAAKTLGITAADTGWSYGGNTGKDSKAPQFSLTGGVIGSAGFQTPNTTGDNVPLTDANLQDAASRAVFTALQSSTLPKFLQGVFDGFSASATNADGTYKMTGQQVTDTLALAQSYADLHTQLQSLPFDSLKDLSYAAAAGLVTAAGGMANLGASLGTYYTKFYSATEQTAILTKNTGDAFVSLGDVMPALTEAGRVQYRAMVDAAAATVQQNDALGLVNTADSLHYTGLLSLATAYDTLNPIIASTVTSLADLQKSGVSLQDQYDKLAMSEADYRTKSIAGMGASQIAQYDANQVIRDQITAQIKQNDMIATNAALTDELAVATGKLTQDQVDLKNGVDASTIALRNAVQAQNDYSAALASASQTANSLAVQLLTAQGNDAGALALQRTQELATATVGLNETQVQAVTTAMQANYATEDQIKTATTNTGLQKQLNDLKDLAAGKTQIEIDRTRTLAGMTDATTISLQKQVYAQQDLAAAVIASTRAMSAAQQVQIDQGTTTPYLVAQANALLAWETFKTALPIAASMTVAEIAAVASDPSAHPEFSAGTWDAITAFLVAAHAWMGAQGTGPYTGRTGGPYLYGNNSPVAVKVDTTNPYLSLLDETKQFIADLAHVGETTFEATLRKIHEAADAKIKELQAPDALAAATDAYQKSLRDAALVAYMASDHGTQAMLDYGAAANAAATATVDITSTITAWTQAQIQLAAIDATRTAYANVQSALAAVGNAVQALADKATVAQQKVNDLTIAAADNLTKFAGTISDFLDTINPEKTGSLASLKAQFSATAVLAAGGDVGAQGKLIGQAQAVLKAAEEGSTSALEYARSEAFVRNTLEPIQKSATTQAADLLATLTTTMKGAGLDIAHSFGLTGDAADKMAGLLSNAGTASSTLATLLAKPGTASSTLATALGLSESQAKTFTGQLGGTAAAALLLTGNFATAGNELALAVQARANADNAYAAGLKATADLVLPTITTDLDKLQIALTAYDKANTDLAKAVAATGMGSDYLATQLGLAGDAAAAFVAAVGTDQTGTAHTVVVPPPAPLVDPVDTLHKAGARELYDLNATATLYHPKGAEATGLDYWASEIARIGFDATKLDFDRTVSAYAGLHPLATGTNYLQQDGPFYGHQGETITPRPYVDLESAARKETNALLARLLDSNKELKTELALVKTASEKTASTINNVTRGGRAMQTEVFV